MPAVTPIYPSTSKQPTSIVDGESTYQPLDADLTALAAAGNSAVLAATTASFLAADETKLDGIETLADVTDATNVTAAGALMDSELADITAIKTLQAPDNTTISTFGASLVDDADASTSRTTLGLGSVDNTSDVNKPISTATQTALNTKTEIVATRTAMASLDSGYSVIFLTESGVEGIYRKRTDDLSAAVTADTDGAYFTPFSSDPTGASGGWWHEPNGAVNFLRWGPDTTGVTSCSALLQKAINFAEYLGGNTIVSDDMGPNLYGMSSGVEVNEGIYLRFAVARGEANTSPPTGRTSGFVALSPFTGTTMITYKPASAANTLGGGGFDGLIDCNGIAAVGLRLSSVWYWSSSILTIIRNTGADNAGLLIENDTGKRFNGIVINRYEHSVGAQASGAHDGRALFISGDDADQSDYGTSVTINWFEASYANGNCVDVIGTDSCRMLRFKSGVRSDIVGSEGYALRLLKSTEGTPNFHTQKNEFHMIGKGKIYIADYVKNNIIKAWTESLEIVKESGGNERANHFELMDFRNGGLWRTKQFLLNDRRELPLTDFTAFGTTATSSTPGGLATGRMWSFSASATNGIGWSGFLPFDYTDGYIIGLEIKVASVGATTGNGAFKIQGVARRPTDAIGSWTITNGASGEVITPAQSAGNTFTTHDLTFTAELACYKGGFIAFTVERLGADAADTFVNAIQLCAVRIIYRSEGPTSAASYVEVPLIKVGGADANP